MGYCRGIGERWYSLKLVEDWKRPGIDICWLEAIALEVLFLFLIQLGYRDTHLLVHSDNKGAIGALTKSRSPNVDLNLCARRTYAMTADHMIVPKLIFVPSLLNVADLPSRGRSQLPTLLRLKRDFQLPQELAPLFVKGDW